MGIYVVIGAGLLGALSCMLIAWSLWSRSQIRKRARQRQLATGQHAAIAPVGGFAPSMQPTTGHTVVAPAPHFAPEPDEPQTEFMSSADLFGEVGAPDEPTQFLRDTELAAYEDEHEVATAFMTEEELFAEAEAHEDQEDQEDDEDEIPTAFMTTDELFGRSSARGDATIVLAEDAVMAAAPPEPQPVRPADRPPIHRMPQGPAAAKPSAPELKPTLPGPRAEPPAARYTGFVGDRTQDRDDEDQDDDFDDDDPETELVHQAELLRLIGPGRRSE